MWYFIFTNTKGETVNTDFSTSNMWFALFNRSLKYYPAKTVLNPAVSVGQSLTYSCGAAIITGVLKSIGRKVNEQEILRKMGRTLQLHKIFPDLHGIPPYILTKTLKMYKVSFSENKGSTRYSDFEARNASIQSLENALLEGSICIVDLQTTPGYWVIHKQTKQVFLKDELPDDEDLSKYELVRVIKKDFNPEKKPKPYLGTRKHGIGYATTSRSVRINGHYVLVVGMFTDCIREYYITVDPAYHYYQSICHSCSHIDPNYIGYRMIEKQCMVNKWRDEEYDGTKTNYWFVEVKSRA